MREEEKLIEEELKSVKVSIKKIGVLVHSSRLQCPNIRKSQKNIENLLRGRTDVIKVNRKLEKICERHICNKGEQIYPCSDKHRPRAYSCRFLEGEDRDRVRISSLLVMLVENSIG